MTRRLLSSMDVIHGSILVLVLVLVAVVLAVVLVVVGVARRQ